ncbi:hypothetical protein HK405_011986, partial [Cladochytrium tenue]
MDSTPFYDTAAAAAPHALARRSSMESDPDVSKYVGPELGANLAFGMANALATGFTQATGMNPTAAHAFQSICGGIACAVGHAVGGLASGEKVDLKRSAQLGVNTALGAFSAKSMSDPTAAAAAFPLVAHGADMAATAVHNARTTDPKEKKPYDVLKRTVAGVMAFTGNVAQSKAAAPFMPNAKTATPAQNSVASVYSNVMGVPLWTTADGVTKAVHKKMERSNSMDSVSVRATRASSLSRSQSINLESFGISSAVSSPSGSLRERQSDSMSSCIVRRDGSANLFRRSCGPA